MRQPSSGRQILLARLLRLGILVLWCLSVRWGADRVPNLCEMTLMLPEFEEVKRMDVGGVDYRMLRYRELGVNPPRSSGKDARKVVFVPGNGGNFAQARSLGRELALASSSIELYALDLRGELSALNGRLLLRQVGFVEACVRSLNVVAIVGHSIGGVASAVAAPAGTKVVALGAPIGHHPLAVDPTLDLLSRKASRREVLSISGGSRDWQVADWMAWVEDMHTSTMDVVGMSADHQCILWCNQLIRVIAKALYVLTSARERHYQTDMS